MNTLSPQQLPGIDSSRSPLKSSPRSRINQKAAIAAFCTAGLTTWGVLANPNLAAAAIVWDYSPATTGANIDGVYSNFAANQNFAEQFLLTQATSLTGMAIYTDQLYAAVGQSVTVRLWDDNAGTPGTLLQTFNENLETVDQDGTVPYSSIGGLNNMVRAFAKFTTPLAISANQRYWIGMSGTNSELAQLTLTGSQAPGDDSAAYFAGTSFLGNVTIGDQAFRLYDDATAVPTPALLPGLVGLGVAVLRRRKLASISKN